MRRALLGVITLSSTLSLSACHNDDAFLGGSHEAYRCGSRCAVEQGAPANAGDWFFNPETALGDAPEIVYPLSGSVHPIDLRRLTVQFRRGRDDFQVFRVRIEAPDSGVVYDFFTPCLAVAGDGCRYLLEGGVWDNARADLVGKPALLSVTGSTSTHGVQRSSQPSSLDIVKSDLRNKGFYYWTTVPTYTNGVSSQTGIFRLPFGADQAEPFIMPTSETNDRQCGACHSVSRDGSTIAFTARDTDGGPDQRSGSLVARLTAQPGTPLIEAANPSTYDSSMMALSYNGTRVLVAYDEQLVLRSSESNPLSTYKPGDVISSLSKADLGGKAGYFPEFSPNDDAVVLTLSDTPDSAIAVQAGDIAVLDFDLATSQFSKEPKIIVHGTDEIFHFYPTWSPNGKYIAFASAPREIAEDGFPRKSYDQKKARLRLVARDGGPIYELANATHQQDKWSTYPKFAPFSAGKEGSLMFLTFNSKINYGLVLDNDSKPTDAMRVAQLWMSAIDESKLPDDPSSAPIWLPFQDPTQPGHLGIWTNEVKCRTDLGGTGCDFGQVCQVETKTCAVVPK
jgi:WD40-like Beta Propeller Repeat